MTRRPSIKSRVVDCFHRGYASNRDNWEREAVPKIIRTEYSIMLNLVQYLINAMSNGALKEASSGQGDN
jgi:hypothetical protein